ncbi:MAG: protein kinase [Phycisphaerales bacterium]|nr:protein kinase [Phycisphaerales bacterium]
MSRAAPTDCPGADALERAIESGAVPEEMRSHLRRCPGCAERARQIGENLRFMAGARRHVGPEAFAEAARAQSETPPPPEGLLPNYRLVREIGRGSQGVLYEAVQLDTKRRVAVKIVDPGAAEASGARRFRREAELAASLRHPNIVTVYHSVVLPDGRLALAMEYVDGVPLDEWSSALDDTAAATTEARRHAVRVKMSVASAVCAAVHHAHSNGVIHRDLKPANVLITPDGTPRVVDFGIARRVDAGTRITRAGGFVGTLAYAAPEQVSGLSEDVDTRADVYALGLLLYESLAGRRPYDTGSSLSDAIASITHREPAPLTVVQPGNLPAGGELQAIVSKALEKAPDERYQSAAALRADIENWLAGRAVDARRHSAAYLLRKAAGRHKAAVAAGCLMFLFLTVFGVSMAWTNRELAHRQAMLSESLARSTVERGRAAARSGENTRAAALLWPRLLASGASVTDPGLLFRSSPEAMRAAWALVELSSRHPELGRWAASTDAAALSLEDGGRTLRVIDEDGEQRLIGVGDGRVSVAMPKLPGPPARFVRVSTSGLHTLFTRPGGAPSVVEQRSGREERLDRARLDGHTLQDLTPDGSRLLTTTADAQIHLWATRPLALVGALTGPAQNRATPRFSHDGLSVTGWDKRRVCVWRASDGVLEDWREVPDEMWTSAVRLGIGATGLTADRSRMVVGFHDKLLLFDMGPGLRGPVRSWSAHRGFAAWLCVPRRGDLIVSVGSELTARVWDLRTGEEVGGFEFSAPGSVPAVVSDDGEVAAVHESSGAVRVFECRPRQWRRVLTTPEHSVHAVRFSPDGSIMAGATADGGVRAWRAEDGKPAWVVRTGADSVEALAFSPDGRRLATSGPDGAVRVLALGDGERPGVVELGTGVRLTTWLGFHPLGRVIVAAGADPELAVLDASSGSVVRRVRAHSVRSAEAAFSPDGGALFVAGSDGGCIALNTEDWTERFRTEPVAVMSRAVAVSPDGRLVAVGSDDWKIRLCDARTGATVRTMTGVRQSVFSLAFHRDGNILFSSGRDSEIQVWDVRTGEELARLDGHRDIVLTLALSPDGRMLATGSADRTAALWDLDYYRRHLMGSVGYWSAEVAKGVTAAP